MEITMEIRVLRYFLAVAREQTISGAAKKLHLSQPTLSRQLMDMEEKFGKQLMIRGTRRITLTEEGMLLRKRAEEIIDLVDKAEADLMASDSTINGDIYIGAGETDAMRLIAKQIKKLRDEYPNIHFHIFSGNAQDVIEKLDKGLLDFGILIEPTDISKFQCLQLPQTDSWGVLMRKDSSLAEKAVVEAEDLWNLPLICSQQAINGKGMEAWIQRKSNKLNIVATYNLIYNASLMVEEGIGCALCLDKLVNTSENSLLCFRPLEPRLEAKLNIVWKKHQVFSKAAQKFLEKLQEDF